MRCWSQSSETQEWCIHKYSCQPRGSCPFQFSHWELIFLSFFLFFFPEIFPLKFRGSICIDCKVIDPIQSLCQCVFLIDCLRLLIKAFSFFSVITHSILYISFWFWVSLCFVCVCVCVSRSQVLKLG